MEPSDSSTTDRLDSSERKPGLAARFFGAVRVFAIVHGIIFLAAPMHYLFRQFPFVVNASATTEDGEIFEKYMDAGSDTTSCRIRYWFRDVQGQRYERDTKVDSDLWKQIIPGQRIPPVEYLIADPGTNHLVIKPERFVAPLCIGLLLCTVGILARWFGRLCDPDYSPWPFPYYSVRRCAESRVGDPEVLDSGAEAPFLLDHASASFLAGDRGQVAGRLAGDRNLVSFVAFAAIVAFFALVYLVQIVSTLGDGAEGAKPKGANLLRDLAACIAVIAVAVFAGVSAVRKDVARTRLVRHGRIVRGRIVDGSAHYAGVGSGEEQSLAYFVEIQYSFSPAPGQEISNRWSRDRDDMIGLPLPSKGTPVLVLFLNETTYILL